MASIQPNAAHSESKLKRKVYEETLRRLQAKLCQVQESVKKQRRFEARIDHPLRQWKLSPMDLLSRERWYEYSRGARHDARAY